MLVLKTMLDRADCADFGCHNSIRLETKHFLNTLALTFLSLYPFRDALFLLCKNIIFFFASEFFAKHKNACLENRAR